MKWAFANAAIIARAREKDLSYIDGLDEKLCSILKSILGLPLFYKLIGEEQNCRSLTSFIYYFVTTGLGNQTLGEEYCSIIPVDVNAGNWAPWWKRILLALFYGPLQSRLDSIPWMSQVAIPLHLALFYWKGKYPDIFRRLLAMRYVYYPRRPPTNEGWDRLYMALSGLVASVALIQAYRLYQAHKLQKLQLERKNPLIIIGKGGGSVSAISGKCPMCLESWKDAAVVTCGHIFCWRCIMLWLREREECPLCRVKCLPASVFCLHQDP